MKTNRRAKTAAENFRFAAIASLTLSAVSMLCSQSSLAQRNSDLKAPNAPPIPENFVMPGGMHFSQDIPKNFPAPAYKSNVVRTVFINPTHGKPSANANIVTTDQPKPVFDWYRDSFTRGGWQTVVPSDKMLMTSGKKKGQMYMLIATKDQQCVRLFCRTGPKQVGTSINMQWTAKERPH